jgi:hypothetical protein
LRQQRLAEPGDPDRRREEQAERQPGGCADRTTESEPPHQADRQRRQCRDFDGDGNARPVEPGSGDACQLDVAQPDALASAQAPVECPQAEEGSRDDAGTQRGEGERFADPVRVPDRRMDEAERQCRG